MLTASIKITVNKIFFLPNISDKLVQIGVITVPEIKYVVRIQEVPNEILRSVIISGIAGINIVSAYIIMIAIIPSKYKVFQANEDIFVSIPLLLVFIIFSYNPFQENTHSCLI
jgi:hypothetical protein